MLDSAFRHSGRSVDETAEEAFASALNNAGATLPRRDAVDTRAIKEVRGGTATYEGVYETKKRGADKSKVTGIINSQNDVGSWPELSDTAALKDSDHDGMPDNWELSKGLNPNEVADRQHRCLQWLHDAGNVLEQYSVNF